MANWSYLGLELDYSLSYTTINVFKTNAPHLLWENHLCASVLIAANSLASGLEYPSVFLWQGVLGQQRQGLQTDIKQPPFRLNDTFPNGNAAQLIFHVLPVFSLVHHKATTAFLCKSGGGEVKKTHVLACVFILSFCHSTYLVKKTKGFNIPVACFSKLPCEGRTVRWKWYNHTAGVLWPTSALNVFI